MKRYRLCEERVEIYCNGFTDYWSERDVIAHYNRLSWHYPHVTDESSDYDTIKAIFDATRTYNLSAKKILEITVYYIEECEIDDDGEELQAITLDMKTDTVGYRYLADFEGDKLVIDEDSDEDAEIAFQGLFAEHLRDAFEGGKTPDDIDLWDIRLSDRDAGWEVTIEDVLGGSIALAREVGIIYTAAKEETK